MRNKQAIFQFFKRIFHDLAKDISIEEKLSIDATVFVKKTNSSIVPSSSEGKINRLSMLLKKRREENEGKVMDDDGADRTGQDRTTKQIFIMFITCYLSPYFYCNDG